jgi:hypothetical protein
MIEAELRKRIQATLPDGRPVDGKLTNLILNIGPDGWQAIAKFWGVVEWNVATGPDPVACILEVLKPQNELPDTNDFSDLLV